MITYSKFTGDREAKSAEILLDGVRVGLLEVLNSEEFQGRASMSRTVRFAEVTVALTGQHARDDRDASFHAADGHTRASGIKAAKALVRSWLAS